VPAEDDVTHRFLRLEHRLARLAWPTLTLMLGGGAAVTGCGAAEPKDNFDQTLLAQANGTAPTDTPKESERSSAKDAKADDLNDDQKAQMEIALRRGGDKAANCGSVVPDTARGEAEVKVTFDGKKGRAVDVQVGAPWAGTDAESCIKRAFVGEIIVPFEGQLEVPYTVKIVAKGSPGKGSKKK
jgi:hypothetical protein